MRPTAPHGSGDGSGRPDAGDGDTPTGQSVRRVDAVRLLLGASYLLGALVHVLLGLRAPETYAEFVDLTPWAAYGEAWRAFVVPNLGVLQPLVVLFELTVGLALLVRGRAVRAGHAGGAVFQLALVPSGPWGVINLGLAAVHAASLRASYPDSVVALVRRGSPGRMSPPDGDSR
jgi:hypothetical protein